MDEKGLAEEIQSIRDLLKGRVKRFESELTKVKRLKEFNALTELTIKSEHAIALLNVALWMLK